MAQGYTPLTFAVAVLRQLGAPVTRQNVQGLVGWQKAEGGHWNNDARYNPLNTTMPMPGAGNTGTQGNIKVYTSWQQGLAATVKTLKNGLYGNILGVLRKGNNAEAIGTAVGNSPWCPGCGQYATNVIRNTKVPAKIPSVTTVLGPPATTTPATNLTATAAKATGTPPKVTTTVTPREVTPDTSLQGVIAQLSQQAQQPTGPASSGYTPPYSKYLSGRPLPASQGFTPAAPSDVGSQIASLSGLVGPSTFYDTKTTVTPGTVTPGKATTPATPKASTPSAPGTPVSSGSGADTSIKGTAKFEGTTVAAWIAPILKYARSKGWKGTVSSGYRSYSEQAGLYAGLLAGTRAGPVAKPGTSNHEGSDFPRGAVDVTDPQALSNILQGSKYGHALVYAGSKDPVHFSHPHNGSY